MFVPCVSCVRARRGKVARTCERHYRAVARARFGNLFAAAAAAPGVLGVFPAILIRCVFFLVLFLVTRYFSPQIFDPLRFFYELLYFSFSS